MGCSQNIKVARGKPGDRRAERRQLAVLRAALIDIGELTHFCRIVNVSSQGVELRLYRAVTRGTRVRIRFASEQAMEGIVVWSRSKYAGVKLDRALDISEFASNSSTDPRQRRRLPRAHVETSASLRVGHSVYPAIVYDISPAGARLRLARPLADKGPALLKLAGLVPLPAIVCWIEGTDIGVKFNGTLEMHVLEQWVGSLRDQDSGPPAALRRTAC